MNVHQIEIERTGLLFFDILNAYYHEAGDKDKERKKIMVENAVRLMRIAREVGIPIFFAKGNHRRDSTTASFLLTDTKVDLQPWPDGIVKKLRPPTIEGETSSDVIPELDPRPDDYYIPKYRWSAFHQTYLDLALRSSHLDTIIISGGSTDVGVAATVFAGRDMDYNMIIVRDACATVHDQRAHDTLMDLIFPRMCRVRTTDEVLRMISEATDRNNVKKGVRAANSVGGPK